MRRLEIAENITKSFARYIVAWPQLERDRESGLDEEERKTKTGFVAARNSHREALYEYLSIAPMYFSVQQWCKDFMRWDELRSDELLAQLPAIAERRKWERLS
jgi:hypothetical protein